MKKNWMVVCLFFLAIGLMGCSSDSQQQLSDLKSQKVIIDYDGEKTVLVDDEAKKFVEILDVDTWEIGSKSFTSGGNLIIESNLYEYIPEGSSDQTKEKHVAKISFYDNNAVVFKIGKLCMNFKISNNIITEIEGYIK